MKDTILQHLKEIEQEYNVTILFAIESGSRAWGMSSKNSDYDVRFVYYHPKEAYLMLNGIGRDVIEKEYKESDLDVVGFDIYKFLGLLQKSNPSCIEWLFSPIAYISGPDRTNLANIMNKNKNPMALFHHYRSMAKNNFQKYLHGKVEGSYKKYLYTMRGLLCALLVEQTKEIPSVEFEEVINKVDVPLGIKTAVLKLIKIKRAGEEKGEGPRLQVLYDFIGKELSREVQLESYPVDIVPFEKLLKDILN